jgi:hypothetical protein
MAEVDWQEDAVLYIQLKLPSGERTARALHTGAIFALIDIALSGRHGPLAQLLIETQSGATIECEAIAELGRRPDRPRSDQS